MVLPQAADSPAALRPFLDEVEKYALGDYMAALLKGSELSDAEKQAVAEKLHGYTGLPVDYLMRANLRVNGGDFSKELKLDENTTIGRLDTRYQGPDVDPLSEGAEYDPQSDAISSAWTAAINGYLRNDLKYGIAGNLFAQRAHGPRLQLGHPPPRAGRSASRISARRHERDARSRLPDEDESENEGPAGRRILRSGDALL